MASRRISLVEQIALLEEATPADYDPEEYNSDQKGALVAPSARENYADVGQSTIRNALPTPLDAKYEGVKASRKELLEGGDNVDAVENEGEEEDSEGFEKEYASETEGGHLEGQGSNNEDDLVPDDIGQRRATQYPSKHDGMENAPQDVASTLRKAREEDILKGQAVTVQLSLWDTLLDTRIRLQKAVVAANRLPPPSSINSFLQAPECRNALDRILNETRLLIDVLDDLQENLLTTNNVVTPPPKKRRKLDPTAFLPGAFVDATEDAAALEEVLHPYLLQTLSKWSAKIQAVAPSALLSSNRGTFLNGNQHVKSAVQLIEENLADNARLLERTQLVRAKKARIGMTQDENEIEALDPEIFDDTDFYQKMLRDIINLRGSGIKNEDWHLQQKRKKAAKRVDTKASKGRKLRFEVHEKMQNFMGPVPVAGAWHDEQIDELFSSILGKGLEDALQNSNSTSEIRQNFDLSGFRVFG